ncbi:CRISPR-associated helicase Cas3' [bacterium]|nr:CRISPR-associated helicase Cas3' [bacterium]MDY2884517.1 CRISPR-associated helicase Cas3' [Bariatricus sp.]
MNDNNTQYYAKSKREDGSQELLRDHLAKVGEMAGVFGEQIGSRKTAELCGKLHDFGKYSVSFKGVLERKFTHIDHALCGAAFLYCLVGNRKSSFCYRAAIEAINGHHDGLIGYDDLKAFLEKSLRSGDPVECNNRKTAALSGQKQYLEASNAFIKDFPQVPSEVRAIEKVQKMEEIDESVDAMLYTRMLFSCLVDADYTISSEKKLQEPLEFKADQCLKALYEYRKELKKNAKGSSAVNELRDLLFVRCGEAARLKEGLFTLTAPTGTGKTLALLHFALRHADEFKKKRIILVLPFLALTEQSYEVYSKIIPEILQDHSQSELDDRQREFAERWESPFIITTSVNFFQALFAQKPTDCRKLHNIANSIILFDEAQSLPANLLAATLNAVNALCSRYHCTMVFSTATQPEFKSIQGVSWKPIEIVPEYPMMYKKLTRTQVEWRMKKQIPLEKIAWEMEEVENVCAIVNLRRHAVKLFEFLKNDHCDRKEIFFLTTDLCPKHRSEVIRKIKERQKAGLPCKVISTQCIEAGVDLDFHVLYRALAPLEAIIQAAGRCNRSGKFEIGKVVVFEPEVEGSLYPPDKWYQNAAVVVKEILSRENIDINNPECISNYYEILFREYAKDKEELTKAIEDRDYKETAREYRLIDNQGKKVIVPFGEKMQLYKDVRKELLGGNLAPKLVKKSAEITVNTFEKDVEKYCEQAYYFDQKKKQKMESGYYVLRTQYEYMYREYMGLQFEEEGENEKCEENGLILG